MVEKKSAPRQSLRAYIEVVREHLSFLKIFRWVSFVAFPFGFFFFFFLLLFVLFVFSFMLFQDKWAILINCQCRCYRLTSPHLCQFPTLSLTPSYTFTHAASPFVLISFVSSSSALGSFSRSDNLFSVCSAERNENKGCTKYNYVLCTENMIHYLLKIKI